MSHRQVFLSRSRSNVLADIVPFLCRRVRAQVCKIVIRYDSMRFCAQICKHCLDRSYVTICRFGTFRIWHQLSFLFHHLYSLFTSYISKTTTSNYNDLGNVGCTVQKFIRIYKYNHNDKKLFNLKFAINRK